MQTSFTEFRSSQTDTLLSVCRLLWVCLLFWYLIIKGTMFSSLKFKKPSENSKQILGDLKAPFLLLTSRSNQARNQPPLVVEWHDFLVISSENLVPFSSILLAWVWHWRMSSLVQSSKYSVFMWKELLPQLTASFSALAF